MEITVWLLIVILNIAIAVFSSWRASLPAKMGKIRMIPWQAIAILTTFLAIISIVHLLNLFGFKTGNSQRY